MNRRASQRPRQLGYSDLVIAAIVAGVGIYVLVSASGMRRLATGDIGAGLFPTVIGVLLLACALGLVIQQMLRRNGRHPDDAPPPIAEESEPDPAAEATDSQPTWRLGLNAAAVIGGILFYVLLADHLGFILTMLVVLLVIQLALRASILTALVTSAVATAALYGLFQYVLLVQLPTGLLGI